MGTRKRNGNPLRQRTLFFGSKTFWIGLLFAIAIPFAAYFGDASGSSLMVKLGVIIPGALFIIGATCIAWSRHNDYKEFKIAQEAKTLSDDDKQPVSTYAAWCKKKSKASKRVNYATLFFFGCLLAMGLTFFFLGIIPGGSEDVVGQDVGQNNLFGHFYGNGSSALAITLVLCTVGWKGFSQT